MTPGRLNSCESSYDLDAAVSTMAISLSGSSGILVARFWCEKENYQAAISAPGFAGGSRNDHHLYQAGLFSESIFQKATFSRGQPPDKAGG